VDTWNTILAEANKLAQEYLSKYNSGVAETILSLAAKAVNCHTVVCVVEEVVDNAASEKAHD